MYVLCTFLPGTFNKRGCKVRKCILISNQRRLPRMSQDPFLHCNMAPPQRESGRIMTALIPSSGSILCSPPRQSTSCGVDNTHLEFWQMCSLHGKSGKLISMLFIYFFIQRFLHSHPHFFFFLNLDVVSVSHTTAPIMTALKKIPKEAKRHPWVSLDQSWESPPASGQQGAVGSSPLRARPLHKCRSGGPRMPMSTVSTSQTSSPILLVSGDMTSLK